MARDAAAGAVFVNVRSWHRNAGRRASERDGGLAD
jgi:hypothetical protein